MQLEGDVMQGIRQKEDGSENAAYGLAHALTVDVKLVDGAGKSPTVTFMLRRPTRPAADFA